MGKGDGNFIVTWDLYGDVTFELRLEWHYEPSHEKVEKENSSQRKQR